jgi:deoxyribodipyrimidine photo-lyase
MRSSRAVIAWFRDDLRLSDHPALHAASKTGAPVVLDEADNAPHARRLGSDAKLRAA